MKMFIQLNAATGEVIKVSPVEFEHSEVLECAEDHPFIQELMRGTLPMDWKHSNGELTKHQPQIFKNSSPSKVDLKSMIDLKLKTANSYVWQTPWKFGTFFITDADNSWRVRKIFEILDNGEFETDVEQFQLFSITHNDDVWRSLGV